MMPYVHLLNVLGPIAFWAVVLVLVLTSLFCAAYTLRHPRRALVYISAVALAVAFLAVAVPGPEAPPIAKVLLGVSVLALSIVGGGPAAQLVLALASRGSVTAGLHGGIVIDERATPDHPNGGTREVLRGGTFIGYLERLATTGAIMAGFPEAIAVLIAIKGVGRFTELEAAEARERFIIGTLVSLIWASVCAGVFRLAVA
ncbi:hypothetical protein G3T36_17075 [Diaminobutyricibacter tongyongensis]|uniref:Uncharacterized protein n=1 Tax=Leifsonia tongyongensis TaxID=1268043 RepID=A0A6L9Y2F1_9MICO|nr:hypothetical protein [Diaminobutyricibacter tongyongensis]NEN07577.1 hypothetical protein [Diaminobutyricibacter tongyongensis]